MGVYLHQNRDLACHEESRLHKVDKYDYGVTMPASHVGIPIVKEISDES